MPANRASRLCHACSSSAREPGQQDRALGHARGVGGRMAAPEVDDPGEEPGEVDELVRGDAHVQKLAGEQVPDRHLLILHERPEDAVVDQLGKGPQGFGGVHVRGEPGHGALHVLALVFSGPHPAQDVHPVGQVDDVGHEQGLAVALLADDAQVPPAGVVVQDRARGALQERVVPQQPVADHGVFLQVRIKPQPVQGPVHGEGPDVVEQPRQEQVHQGGRGDAEMAAEHDRGHAHPAMMPGHRGRYVIQC